MSCFTNDYSKSMVLQTSVIIYEEHVQVVVWDHYLLCTIHCYIQCLLHFGICELGFWCSIQGVYLNSICPCFPLLNQNLSQVTIITHFVAQQWKRINCSAASSFCLIFVLSTPKDLELLNRKCIWWADLRFPGSHVCSSCVRTILKNRSYFLIPISNYILLRQIMLGKWSVK